MSAERDAGLAALQNGNAAEAIPYLERAADSAPNDLQTLLVLGAAYGQTSRHADAVRIVMQAVTMQPSNAAARYGLAVAYANAGHREYALTAAQQALQLQPEYPQARELVARLSGAPSVPTGLSMGYEPTAQTAAPLSSVQPTQTFPGQPAAPTAYGQPASPSPYGQTQMPTAPGQPSAGQAAPPYGAPGGAAYPPQAVTGSYQGHGAAAYGGSPPAAYYTPPARPGVVQPPDKFDMKQAVTDWMRVIREPDTFFREQAERTGYNAPISFLVAFGIAGGVFAIISSLIQLALHPSSLATILLQMILGAVGGVISALMGAFLWGGVLHLVGRMFGNRQPYHKTFRVSAYSRAPMLIISGLMALIVPFVLPAPSFTPRSTSTPSPFGQVTPVQFTVPTSPDGAPGRNPYSFPGQSSSGASGPANPFAFQDTQKILQAYEIIGPLSLIGLIWVWCLQAIGLKYAQNISSGAAGGTVFTALLIPFVILLVIGVLFGILIASLMGASRGPSGVLNALSTIPSGLAVWRGL
ncbi:MAG: Tetratricopeptide repeat [Chthonomonadaceae bacterium]|nr:Tetratricopeptide repeat [Chthonomonadaceae bacterium]